MKQSGVIKVFVASPNDVVPERQALNMVIDELNLVLGPLLSVKFELVRWETHTYPAVGSDPQNVINSQVDADYDVFVGIFWSRIGTPTPRAASGTVEEFDRAYRRHLTDPGSIEIMIYFKEGGIPPSQIDPDQLRQLQEFRASLPAKGIRYQTLKDTDEFTRQARVQLGLAIQKFAKPKVEASIVSNEVRAITTELSAGVVTADADLDDPDIGELDVIEAVAEASEAVNRAFTTVSDGTVKMGEIFKEKAAELASVSSDRDRKRIINELARFIVDYSNLMDRTIPIIRSHQQRMSKATAVGVNIFPEASAEELSGLSVTMAAVVDQYRGGRENVEGLLGNVRNSGRMTSEFNKARRRLITSLEGMSETYHAGELQLLALAEAVTKRASN